MKRKWWISRDGDGEHVTVWEGIRPDWNEDICGFVGDERGGSLINLPLARALGIDLKPGQLAHVRLSHAVNYWKTFKAHE